MARKKTFGDTLSYLGQKAWGGLVGSVEGIWDFTAGGIADWVGADDWAEEQFKTDWMDYEAADRWYQPTKGWKFAGDVFAGLGNSIPALGIGLATGGAGLLPAFTSTFGVSSLSAGGNAVKEAYRDTGKLDSNAWKYGALSGATEGLVEGAGTIFGLGQGAVLKHFGKTAAKSAARSSLVGTLISGAAGEAGEEFITAALDPYFKRQTYDPNAQFNLGEALYSTGVGAMSGMLMGGTGYGARQGADLISGTRISGNQESSSKVINAAKAVRDFENKNHTENEVFGEIVKAYDKLESSLNENDGKYTPASRKTLGYLNERLGVAMLQPQFIQAAETILVNPQATVDSINKFYGNENLTVEELTKGVDSKVGEKGFSKAVMKAVKSNSTLRELIAIQTLGNIELDSRNYADAIFGDTPISQVATQENINRFVASQDQNRVEAVSKALGVDMRTATAPEVAAAIENARNNGGLEQYRAATEAIRAAKKVKTSVGELQSAIMAQGQGAVRYTVGGQDVAVIRNGNNFRLYDYESGNVSRNLTAIEAVRAIQQIKKAAENGRATVVEVNTRANTENAQRSENSGAEREENANQRSSKTTLEAKNEETQEKNTDTPIEKARAEVNRRFCKENVPEYNKLITNTEREAVEMTVRQARLNGMSDADAAILGRIAAKSGMNIYVKPDIPGENAFYDGTNGIYVSANAEKSKLYSGLLGHEMFHKLFASKKGARKLYNTALRNIDEKTKKEIIDRYTKAGEAARLKRDDNIKISFEEAAAAYSEEIFNDPEVWDYILGEETSLKEDVINFFTGAAKKYSFESKISIEARKWVAKYRKLFNSLSHDNVGASARRNASRLVKTTDDSNESKTDENKALTTTNEQKMHVSGKRSSLKVVEINGNVTIVNPYEITDDNVMKWLEMSKQRKLEDNTYFPVMQETPQTIIASLHKHGIEVRNNPLAMQAVKARRSQSNSKILHGHSVSASEIIETLEKMSEPMAIIQELEHYEMINGQKKYIPERFAIFVNLQSGDESLAILQFDSEIDPKYLVKDGVGENYNTTVTVFKPNPGYDSRLMEKDYAVEIEIIKEGLDSDFTIGGTPAAKTEKKPSATSIPENSSKINPFDKNSSESLKNAIESRRRSSLSSKEKPYSKDYADKVVNRILSEYMTFGTEYGTLEPSKKKAAVNMLYKGLNNAESGKRGNVALTVADYIIENAVVESDSDNSAEVYRNTVELLKPYLHTLKLDSIKAEIKHRFDKDNSAYLLWGKRKDKVGLGVDEAAMELRGLGFNITSENEADIFFEIHDAYKEAAAALKSSRGLLEAALEPAERKQMQQEIAKQILSAFNKTDTEKKLEKPTLKPHKYELVRVPYSTKDAAEMLKRIKGSERIENNDHNELVMDISKAANNIENPTERVDFIIKYTNKIMNLVVSDEMMESLTSDEFREKKAEIRESLEKMLNTNRRRRMTAWERNEARHEENIKQVTAELGKKIVEQRERNAKLQEKRREDLERKEEYFQGVIQNTRDQNNARFEKMQERHKKELEDVKAYARAQSQSDKIFSKAEVYKALEAVPGADVIKKSQLAKIADELWIELNQVKDVADFKKKMQKLSERVLFDIVDVTNSEGFGDYTETLQKIGDISDGILEAVTSLYDKGGNKTLRSQMREMQARNKALLALDQTILKIREEKFGSKFDNATKYKDSTLKELLKALSSLDYRRTFADSNVREKVKKLGEWYDEKNPMLAFEKDNPGLYVESIKNGIEAIANGEGNLNVGELRALNNILTYFIKFEETFDKVLMNNKWVSGKEMSEKFIKVTKDNEIVLHSKLRAYRNIYTKAFGTPEAVMSAADGFSDGFFSTMYKQLREGNVQADIAVMEISEDCNKFLKENKKYANKLTDKVELRGVKLTRIELLSYYMSLHREDAWEALAYNGFFVNDEGRDVRIKGFAKRKELTQNELENKTQAEIERIKKGRLKKEINAEIERIGGKLNDKDKQFVELLNKGFEAAKELKAKADIERLGFSNVIDGYYYPTKRAYMGTKTVDPAAEASYVDRFTYASFNKHTKEHAQQPLYITSAWDTFQSHIKGVAYYTHVSPVIDTYNKLWKFNTGTDANNPVSLETVTKQSDATWFSGRESVGNIYFKGLVNNIMNGSKESENIGGKAVNYIRGKAVTYSLAFNPKVWFTQFSSLFAASSKLGGMSILRGTFTVSGKDVDKYCPLAKLRNEENAVVKAYGAVEHIDSVGEFLTKPISVFDRIVIKRLFAAAQVQAAKNGGPKVGTEANKIKAGKILHNVILTTQQNSITTTKADATRNGGETAKLFMMFKSDAIQTQGNVIISAGEHMAVRKKLGQENLSAEEKARLKSELKKANKSLLKSVGALVITSAFMVMVTELFKHIYNKDREDDEIILHTLGVDFIGNMLGGLPVISDIYEFFAGGGYELESMEIGLINDLLTGTKEIADYFDKLSKGEADERDSASMLRGVMYKGGQLLGIPTRNIHNVWYGLTKRFSEPTAYKIDDKLKKQSYSSDLKEAIKDDKYALAAAVVSVAYESNIGEGLSDDAISELVRLSAGGADVIPSSVGKQITVNKQEIVLTAEDRETIIACYQGAIPALNDLISSDVYERYDDEKKAKKVRALLNKYRNLGYDVIRESYGAEKSSSSKKVWKSLASIKDESKKRVSVKSTTATAVRSGYFDFNKKYFGGSSYSAALSKYFK